jgi:trans-aconitate methyltransferase
MGVATHLGINLAEYDKRIRTFIPNYQEMLGVAAGNISAHAKTIVDLGVGTGALASLCLKQAPHARVVGIDSDQEILTLAARRLGRSAMLVCDSFLRAELPPCEVIVASFALHHVRTPRAKANLYRRIRAAVRAGGRFITVDCNPAKENAVARKQRRAWAEHLRKSYSKTQAANSLPPGRMRIPTCHSIPKCA